MKKAQKNAKLVPGPIPGKYYPHRREKRSLHLIASSCQALL